MSKLHTIRPPTPGLKKDHVTSAHQTYERPNMNYIRQQTLRNGPLMHGATTILTANISPYEKACAV